MRMIYLSLIMTCCSQIRTISISSNRQKVFNWAKRGATFFDSVRKEHST